MSFVHASGLILKPRALSALKSGFALKSRTHRSQIVLLPKPYYSEVFRRPSFIFDNSNL